MAIRLYTGRRGDHMSKIFLMVIFFCMSHELLLGANKDFELKFEEFEKNPFLKPDPFSSTLKLDKEKLKEIVNMGVPIIPKIIDNLRKNSSSGVAITIITYLTKIQFEFIYDENKCIYTYNDYNNYAYSPPVFQKGKVKFDSIWVYWWDSGRKLTPEIFKRKYETYQTAKNSGKEDELEKAYIKLQNMGIIILPNLLEKIESGDKELIPIFKYLSNQKNLKTVEDCKVWWEENKRKYKDLLNY